MFYQFSKVDSVSLKNCNGRVFAFGCKGDVSRYRIFNALWRSDISCLEAEDFFNQLFPVKYSVVKFSLDSVPDLSLDSTIVSSSLSFIYGYCFAKNLLKCKEFGIFYRPVKL